MMSQHQLKTLSYTMMVPISLKNEKNYFQTHWCDSNWVKSVLLTAYPFVLALHLRQTIQPDKKITQGYSNVFTLYTLTSICIFSILFSIHFPRFWQGEFVKQSRASSVSDQFLYSHDLNGRFRSDIVRRNQMLITLGVKGLNTYCWCQAIFHPRQEVI